MFWPVYGLAIRAAQSMGLHRDPALWGLDEKEVERRRTTFWEVACVRPTFPGLLREERKLTVL